MTVDDETPFVRNVRSGRIHHVSCTRAGACVPVEFPEIAHLGEPGVWTTAVTAECCGAWPGMWVRYRRRAES